MSENYDAMKQELEELKSLVLFQKNEREKLEKEIKTLREHIKIP